MFSSKSVTLDDVEMRMGQDSAASHLLVQVLDESLQKIVVWAGKLIDDGAHVGKPCIEVNILLYYHPNQLLQ